MPPQKFKLGSPEETKRLLEQSQKITKLELTPKQLAALPQAARPDQSFLASPTPVSPVLGSQDFVQRPSPVIAPPSPVITPSIQNIPTAPPVKVEPPQPKPELEKILEEFEGSISKFGTRETAIQEKIGTAGFNIEKEIAELNEQIEMNKAEELGLKERAEEKNVLDPFATGEAARAQRQLAINTLRLSARANTLQAKYNIAEKQATQAVNAEFAEFERDIRTKKRNIIANYDQFTPAEKRRADALLIELDSQDSFVKDKKEERKEILKIGLEATKKGVDNVTYQKIIESDSIEETLNLAAPFLKEKEEIVTGTIGEFQRIYGRMPTAGEFFEFQRKQAEARRKPAPVPSPVTPTKSIDGETVIEPKELTSPQKTRLDAINTVSSQLKNYRDLIERYTGITGIKLTGTKAAELRTAKSALEFSIANAVGTGALQSADRAVVRDLLPDPTSITGAIGGAIRGGKKGNLAAIDQAQKIFDSAKNTILIGTSANIKSTISKPDELRTKYNY